LNHHVITISASRAAHVIIELGTRDRAPPEHHVAELAKKCNHFRMSVLEVTPTTVGWQDAVARHLKAGEHAYIRFELPTVTPAEMAESIGISRQALMRWIDQGKIRFERHGNRYRIPTTEVERFRSWYIQELGQASAADAMADLFGDE